MAALGSQPAWHIVGRHGTAHAALLAFRCPDDILRMRMVVVVVVVVVVGIRMLISSLDMLWITGAGVCFMLLSREVLRLLVFASVRFRLFDPSFC